MMNKPYHKLAGKIVALLCLLVFATWGVHPLGYIVIIAVEPLVGFLHPEAGWDGITILVIYGLFFTGILMAIPVYFLLRKFGLARNWAIAASPVFSALAIAGNFFFSDYFQ
jgi:hypothetical protein